MTIIKTQSFGKLNIQLIKNDVETFGGLYSVICKERDYVSAEKNGLCLDAAIEVYNNSVNFFSTQQTFKSTGI
jgi:hypothetical protein